MASWPNSFPLISSDRAVPHHRLAHLLQAAHRLVYVSFSYLKTSTYEVQNTATRIAVCMRDRCCLITGQPAVKWAHGGNFTGLEVAHIFPLMGVSTVSLYLNQGIRFSPLTHSHNGQNYCQRPLKRKCLVTRLPIVLTMLFSSKEIYTVYLMIINGAYG